MMLKCADLTFRQTSFISDYQKSLIDKFLFSSISSLDKTQFLACIATSKACFEHAKKNQFAESFDAFREFTICFNEVDKSSAHYPWVEVLCCPFISYYYYKCKEKLKAILMVQGLIERLLQFEQRYDKIFAFSLVQQQQNLGRIYFSEHDLWGGVDYYNRALDTLLKINLQQDNATEMSSSITSLYTSYLFQIVTECLWRALAIIEQDEVAFHTINNMVAAYVGNELLMEKIRIYNLRCLTVFLKVTSAIFTNYDSSLDIHVFKSYVTFKNNAILNSLVSDIYTRCFHLPKEVTVPWGDDEHGT